MHKFAWSALLLACSVAPSFAAVDPLLLALVPNQTKVLVGIDAQHTADSTFVQTLLQHQNAGARAQQLLQQTGFDPRHDLQYALIASTGAGRENPNVVLMHGTFNVDRITAAATQNGGKLDNIPGATMIQFQAGDGPQSVAFLGNGVVVAGPLDAVRNVIAARATPSILDPALSGMVGDVGESDLWLASIAPATAFPMSFGNSKSAHLEQAQILQAVVAESAAVQFGENVQVTINAFTRSPQDANALADVVRFAANMAETQAQNSPKQALLASALTQNLQINPSGSSLRVSLSIPEGVLEQAVFPAAH